VRQQRCKVPKVGKMRVYGGESSMSGDGAIRVVCQGNILLTDFAITTLTDFFIHLLTLDSGTPRNP
jgi:hypothetical protein